MYLYSLAYIKKTVILISISGIVLVSFLFFVFNFRHERATIQFLLERGLWEKNKELVINEKMEEYIWCTDRN